LFNIPSAASNISEWDSAWERLLPTLSVFEVFRVVGPKWLLNSYRDLDRCKAFLRSEELVAKLWDELTGKGKKKTLFVHVWLLAREEDRRRHVLRGISEACGYAVLGQDARALCPEITTSALLKHGGWGFVQLAHLCAEGVKKVGVGTGLTVLWSDWWAGAVRSHLRSPTGETVRIHPSLSIERELFILAVILLTITSVLQELDYKSPIATLLRTKSFFTGLWTKAIVEGKIQCEYCTGHPSELGDKVKYMRCSGCKNNTRLPIVRYCSQSCQREDWMSHKTRCGKSGKPTSAEADSGCWRWAVPDDPVEAGIPKKVDIEQIFPHHLDKPAHPSRPHSPALDRQISLLKVDADADYFVFDETDQPVRFAVSDEDKWMKMSFRDLREMAFFGNGENMAIESITEYLLRNMADRPGLSREMILAQIAREYGQDLADLAVEFEQAGRERGYDGHATLLESMSRDMPKIVFHLRD